MMEDCTDTNQLVSSQRVARNTAHALREVSALLAKLEGDVANHFRRQTHSQDWVIDQNFDLICQTVNELSDMLDRSSAHASAVPELPYSQVIEPIKIGRLRAIIGSEKERLPRLAQPREDSRVQLF